MDKPATEPAKILLHQGLQLSHGYGWGINQILIITQNYIISIKVEACQTFSPYHVCVHAHKERTREGEKKERK